MSRAGTHPLDDDDYLTRDERKRRAKDKREQAVRRGLTPDWFHDRDDACLPPGLRVAVIGAGFAGLAAAWYLRECGVRTTVYEAGGRTGGRVFTDRSFVKGKVIEAGAELIGENHALWGLLARRFGLMPLVELSDHGALERMRFGDVVLTPVQKAEMKAALRKPLAEIGAEAVPISETQPWTSPGAKGYDDKPVSKRLDELLGPVSTFARRWFDFTLGNDNCAPAGQQSYLGLLASVSAGRMGSDARGMLGYWMSTETHRCAGGNDRLAQHLARRLPDVRLRTSADRVRIEAAFVPPVRLFSTERDDSGAVLRQRQDDFDFVVLTAPATVWNAIRFEPPFDPLRRTIQHGPAVKFMSRYDSAFWQAAKQAPNAKWDRLGSVWEGTDNQGTAPDFDLTVFSGGTHVLAAKDYAPRLTVLYPTGRPTGQWFVDWTAEPFIHAGYAIPGVGQVMSVSPYQLVPHAQRLYFAGEQSSVGFFGYMEGALQSGARAARDIVLRSLIACPGAPMRAEAGQQPSDAAA